MVSLYSKRCSGCRRRRLAAANFYRDSSARDGWRHVCKDCDKIRARRWNVNNRDRYNGNQREYNKRHSALHVERVRQWCQDNPEKARRLARQRDATRRARLLNAFVEHVDPFVVYERDEGICGICGKEVDMDAFHVDHVVPLACGGEHSYGNVQTAHKRCNQKKGAKVLARTNVIKFS